MVQVWEKRRHRLQLKVTLPLGMSIFFFSIPSPEPECQGISGLLVWPIKSQPNIFCAIISMCVGIISLIRLHEPPLVLMSWVCIGSDDLSLHWFWCLEWTMKILKAYLCLHYCSLTLSGSGREEKHLAITYPDLDSGKWGRCWGSRRGSSEVVGWNF